MSILPGDVIPNFSSWPELARRAHLNQKLVCEKPDADLMELEQKLDGGAVAEPALPEPAAYELDAAPLTDVAAAMAVDVATCELCNRVFKDANGLKIHQSRVHKSVARQED